MKNFSCLPFILVVLLISASCGMPFSRKNDMVYKPGTSTRLYAKSDDVFSEYVAMFEAAAAQELQNPYYKVKDVPINFGDTENENFDGVCFSYSDNSKEIIIKKDFWNRASLIQKRVLIFHELGHCALGRTHEEGTETGHSGVVYKTSLMHPTIPNSMHYLKAEGEYNRELFTLDKAPLVQKIQTQL